MPSTPYVRGTKTVRITTARLRPGNALLTEYLPSGNLRPAGSKTSAIVRTVARVETGMAQYGRRNTRYRVTFDDGTRSTPLVPHQTWAIVADTVQARP